MSFSAIPCLPTDRTPYNLSAVGTYRGTESITWITEHIDLLSHYRNVGAVVYDSILDSAATLNTDFYAGFYASSQEVNALIYDIPDWNTQYNERLADTADVWFWLLIKHYLDSIGTSTDSACLAWLDTAWSTVNDGRGDTRSRSVDRADTLDYNKRFVSYQTFDNDTDDTAFYPAGYLWLANGKNTDVQDAIAYAFRVRVYNSAFRTAVEGGDYGPMNYIFMDNQYRTGGFLGSYWTITSTDGGPTAGTDFTGGNTDVNIESSAGGVTYYDESTCMIDSALKLALDTHADDSGYNRMETFANVCWWDSLAALKVAPYVSGLFFEGPLQPDRTAGLWNAQWNIAAGLILDHDTTMALYMVYGDFSSYFDEGQDRADMAHYCFFLTIQNYSNSTFTTYLMGSSYLDWTGSFHDLFKVDLGYPTPDTAMNAHYSGTGWYGSTPYRWVKSRIYTSDGAVASDTTAVILFGTTHGSTYDWNDDSVEINLAHGDNKVWYEVGVDADTSAIADSIFYVKPYEGVVVVAAQPSEAAPVISNIQPDTGIVANLDTLSCVMEDDYGIDEIWNYIWPPDSTPGVNDSVHVHTTVISPVDPYIEYENEYTWVDSGWHWIVFVATDDSANSTAESLQIFVDVSHVYPVISSIRGTKPYVDSTGVLSANITDNGGTKYVYCWVRDPSNDSLHVGGDTLSPVDTDTTMSYTYMWLETGTFYIHFKAIDEEPAMTHDSAEIIILSAGYLEDAIIFADSTGMIDAYGDGRSGHETDSNGALVYLYVSHWYYHSFMGDYSMDDSLDEDWVIDSMLVIFQTEATANYFSNDTTYLFLSMMADDRTWVELQLSWNNYQSGVAWDNGGGDVIGCMSDTIKVYQGSHAAGTWDTFKVHTNTEYGEMYMDSMKVSTGNYGFGIGTEMKGTADGGEIVYIRSTEYAVSAYRPYMVVYPHSVVAAIVDAGTIWQGIDIQGVDIR
jgi:hypothetical protein